MNHAKEANVFWKKQKLGPTPAMHFYTSTAIEAGDELCFNCARASYRTHAAVA